MVIAVKTLQKIIFIKKLCNILNKIFQDSLFVIAMCVLCLGVVGSSFAQKNGKSNTQMNNQLNGGALFDDLFSDTSDTNTVGYIQINLGAPSLVVEVGNGIIIALKGNNWTYDYSGSNIANKNSEIVYLAVEDFFTESKFIFYKKTTGIDTLQFKRYDEEENVLYTYIFMLNWTNASSSKTITLHRDKYAEVVQLPLDSLALAKNLLQNNSQSKTTMFQNNTQTESAPAITQPTPPAATTPSATTPSAISSPSISTKLAPVISTPATEKDSNNKSTPPIQTETVKPKNNEINLLNQNNNAQLLDENNLMTNQANAMQQSGSVIDTNTNRLNDLMLPVEPIEMPIDVSQLSFDEMLRYINTHFKTKQFDEIKQNIDTWIQSHSDNTEQATLLWQYARMIEKNLKTSTDVDNMLMLYKIIANEYPLSYEFQDAVKKIEEIKTKYLFILQ